MLLGMAWVQLGKRVGLGRPLVPHAELFHVVSDPPDA
jgi:hypothetical protein